MYVQLLDGRYAGQTRDIEDGAARGLIQAGRAKNPFAEPTRAEPPLALIPEAPKVAVEVPQPVVHAKKTKR